MGDLGILILRVCLGVVFVAHGLQAVFGFFGGPGMEGFAKMLGGIGFKPALFWAYLGAYTELLGGIFVTCGVFTRISAAFIFIFITVAAVTVHLSKGFFAQQGGFEYNFVLACVCIALILLGPGKISISQKF